MALQSSMLYISHWMEWTKHYRTLQNLGLVLRLGTSRKTWRKRKILRWSLDHQDFDRWSWGRGFFLWPFLIFSFLLLANSEDREDKLSFLPLASSESEWQPPGAWCWEGCWGPVWAGQDCLHRCWVIDTTWPTLMSQDWMALFFKRRNWLWTTFCNIRSDREVLKENTYFVISQFYLMIYFFMLRFFSF